MKFRFEYLLKSFMGHIIVVLLLKAQTARVKWASAQTLSSEKWM